MSQCTKYDAKDVYEVVEIRFLPDTIELIVSSAMIYKRIKERT